MQAAAFTEFGPPEVLRLQDVERPRPQAHDVLIRVHAAGVNPIDWRIRSGSLRYALPGKFPWVVGFDVAGVVEEVGEKVSQPEPGEEVLSFLDKPTGGGYAEYAVASEKVVVPKPRNVSFEQAAAVPLAASTALQCLRDYGKVREGMQVLINGASGGVGSFAVQLARHFGAAVTGVCRGEHHALVEQLGAAEQIDYREEDFARRGARYDLILDAVGKSSFGHCRPALTQRGRYVKPITSAASAPKDLLLAGVTKLLTRRRSLTMLARPRGDDLRFLTDLLESGELRAVIEETFPLSQAADAHRRSEEGHVTGKLVLQIAAA